MRFWRDKFQAMAAAVAFAQAGEWETAKSLLRKPIGRQIDRPATISRRPNRQARRLLFAFRIAVRGGCTYHFPFRRNTMAPESKKKSLLVKTLIYGALPQSFMPRFFQMPTLSCIFLQGEELTPHCPLGRFFLFVRTRSFCREFMVTSGHRSHYKAARKTGSGPGSSSDSESPASPALERLIFL